MTSPNQSNQQLYGHVKNLLHRWHKDPDNFLLNTLAMMVTGLFLGRHVQLWEIALWVPVPIQLTSLVRRFERFVADPRVKVAAFFHPFVLASIACLGNETAYLILDCTQAGKKCRTLVVGLAYHGTVLPLAWKTSQGKKGHLKGEFHRALLQQVYPYLRYHRRVIVLGDAEFSNEPVIRWLVQVNWGFVLRFQHSYQVQTTPTAEWQSVQQLYQARQLQAGQVHHWSNLVYTYQHQIPDLTVTVYWGEQEPEPWCLVSNLSADQQPHLIYPKRFWIETLFGNHKSRGFQLARTHLTDPQQIDRLVLALAIATYITLGLGTELIVSGQTKLVDRTDRRDLSLFQLGWRYLYRLLALDRLVELKITFRWDIKLPPAGFQPAS
jgi:hypothetical protein